MNEQESRGRFKYFCFLTPDSFNQTVKKIYEPTVCFAWVKKLKQRNQTTEVFLVGTRSQLYLCKVVLYIGPLIITKKYPWVNLKSATRDGNVIKFQFVNEEQLKFIVIDPDKMISNLMNFFHSFFNEDKFKSINPFPRSVYTPSKRNFFLNIFISYCYAANVSYSEPFFLSLYRQSKSSRTIDVTMLPLDRKVFVPLKNSLMSCTNFKAIKIRESKLYNIFEFLEELINKNKYFSNIQLFEVGDMKGFERFLAALEHRKVHSLEFINCNFSSVLSSFLKSSCLGLLKRLRFINCGINEERLDLILKNGELFESLIDFCISSEKTYHTSSDFEALSQFVLSRCITHFEFRNNNVSIPFILKFFNKDNMNINCINLSQNNFTSYVEDENRLYLPSNLTKLVLKNVRWNVALLLQFLTVQKFNKETTINLSGIEIKDKEWGGFFAELGKIHDKIENNIVSLTWEDNELDHRFIRFLTLIPTIQMLSISNCRFDESKKIGILNNLATFVTNLDIKKLKLRGSKSTNYSEIIVKLLPVLKISQTFQSLDISNNKIGDKIFDELITFVRESKSIKKLSFDNIGVKNVDQYTRLLSIIVDSETITKVKYMHDDIWRLTSNNIHAKKQVDLLWETIKRKTDGKQKQPYSDIMSTGNDLNTQIIVNDRPKERKSSAKREEKVSHKFEFSLRIPYQSGIGKWELMRERYSIKNLSSSILS